MAQDALPQLTMRAPISGIFQVARKRRSRDNIAVGDDVRFGTMVGSGPRSDLDEEFRQRSTK